MKKRTIAAIYKIHFGNALPPSGKSPISPLLSVGELRVFLFQMNIPKDYASMVKEFSENARRERERVDRIRARAAQPEPQRYGPRVRYQRSGAED